ncbi:MAG: chromate resistance protein [Burkholderiales bacterium]|nr:chromate resistance protein [Burkholderiales bacterium]
MTNWIIFITSLPTENATARMRAWRALKASGAAVLRDGVYLLPATSPCRSSFQVVEADVIASGGAAYLLDVEAPEHVDFRAMFDRSEEYGTLMGDVAQARNGLSAETALDTLKQCRKLRKGFQAISDVDFFPGEARRQADASLQALEALANQVLSPNEPHPVAATLIAALSTNEYQGRTWATRRRPWVDRLACAWLIRKFVDRDAQFLWLESPADCPPDALGFDFDGAQFTHVGAKVSFEVLVESFGLTSPALERIGALVHYLDVGGIQPAEAAGVEQVLAGLRQVLEEDDQLVAAAGHVFDGLLIAFTPKQDDKTDPRGR